MIFPMPIYESKTAKILQQMMNKAIKITINIINIISHQQKQIKLKKANNKCILVNKIKIYAKIETIYVYYQNMNVRTYQIFTDNSRVIL